MTLSPHANLPAPRGIPNSSEFTNRLSCAQSAFPLLSLDGALAVIVDLGFTAVDICMFEGCDHFDPSAIVAEPLASAERLGLRLEALGLTPADVFAIFGDSFESLAPNHPDPDVRRQSMRCFEACLKFAKALGAAGMTVLPGSVFEGIDPNVSTALAAAELTRRTELAGELGLRLSWEPHLDSVVKTPNQVLALLEQARGSKLTLDCSTFVYQSIDQSEIDSLLGHTGHLHVRQAAPGALQTRTNEGTIDLTRLRDALLSTGYAGYFTIEYQWEEGPLDFTHIDCIAETSLTRAVLLAGKP